MFRWHPRAARAPDLTPERAGLERVDPLEAVAAVEGKDCPRQAPGPSSAGPRPTQERCHMLGAVVKVPCPVIDRLPFRGAHSRVFGSGVLRVVAVQVWLQPPAREVKIPMID